MIAAEKRVEFGERGAANATMSALVPMSVSFVTPGIDRLNNETHS